MENNNFEWEIGRVYRAKTGELLQLLRLTETECFFQMLDPKTKEPAPYELGGPREGLEDMRTAMGLEPVEDIQAHKPTGLIMSPEDPRWRLH